MNLGNLIEMLQDTFAEHGDLPVFIHDSDGGHVAAAGLMLGTAEGTDEIIDATIVDALTLEDVGEEI